MQIFISISNDQNLLDILAKYDAAALTSILNVVHFFLQQPILLADFNAVSWNVHRQMPRPKFLVGSLYWNHINNNTQS